MIAKTSASPRTSEGGSTATRTGTCKLRCSDKQKYSTAQDFLAFQCEVTLMASAVSLQTAQEMAEELAKATDLELEYSTRLLIARGFLAQSTECSILGALDCEESCSPTEAEGALATAAAALLVVKDDQQELGGYAFTMLQNLCELDWRQQDLAEHFMRRTVRKRMEAPHYGLAKTIVKLICS